MSSSEDEYSSTPSTTSNIPHGQRYPSKNREYMRLYMREYRKNNQKRTDDRINELTNLLDKSLDVLVKVYNHNVQNIDPMVTSCIHQCSNKEQKLSTILNIIDQLYN